MMTLGKKVSSVKQIGGDVGNDQLQKIKFHENSCKCEKKKKKNQQRLKIKTLMTEIAVPKYSNE